SATCGYDDIESGHPLGVSLAKAVTKHTPFFRSKLQSRRRAPWKSLVSITQARAILNHRHSLLTDDLTKCFARTRPMPFPMADETKGTIGQFKRNLDKSPRTDTGLGNCRRHCRCKLARLDRRTKCLVGRKFDGDT